MSRDRLTAFTDGVMAVIITIMVLEMKPPHGSELSALAAVAPTFLAYVLSFIYVAIYWNNHHHFFQLVRTVDGGTLWANLHLLFWLSLVPFATAWMGGHPNDVWPTVLYGAVMLAAGLAFFILTQVIVRAQGQASLLRAALGNDLKGKISPVLYLAGIVLAFVDARLSYASYAAVALLWLIPDRRIEAAAARTDA